MIERALRDNLGTTLRQHLMIGIKGKVFSGIVGGRHRHYTPLQIVVMPCSQNDIYNLRVNIVSGNVPKKIERRREEYRNNQLTKLLYNSEGGYYDYEILLSRHLNDFYTRELNDEDRSFLEQLR